MSQAISRNTPISTLCKLSDSALADALGHADVVLKGAEAQAKALKDEVRRRGLTEAGGENFLVTCTEQLSERIDTAAVKAHLGTLYSQFTKIGLSTVIRIKAVPAMVDIVPRTGANVIPISAHREDREFDATIASIKAAVGAA
jgi:hypothetical protein